MYRARHNAALKILFFDMLRGYQLADAIPSWYSPVQPKPVYQDDNVTEFWDVPVFAEHLQVRANRVDVRFVDRENKEMMLIKMNCPCMDNRKQEEEETTLKYAPLRLELKRQHPGFKIPQFDIVMNSLGGYSKSLKEEVKAILGSDRY